LRPAGLRSRELYLLDRLGLKVCLGAIIRPMVTGSAAMRKLMLMLLDVTATIASPATRRPIRRRAEAAPSRS
jgi:hypothetical protein